MGLPGSSSSWSDRFTAVMPRYISATCISHPEMAVTTLDHKGIVLMLVCDGMRTAQLPLQLVQQFTAVLPCSITAT